jgi:DNA-binding NarL/FixJ family response regulator
MADLMSLPIRVVIVDDEALVRAGLRMILGGDASIEIVGEAGDGVEAVAVIARTRPDVVLMDIRMPRCDGLVATERARAADPDLKIIVLTTFDTDDLVLRAIRLGAIGFLLKDTRPEDLVEAIRLAAAGRSMLSPSVTDQLIAAVASQPPPRQSPGARTRLDRLTERESEVALAVGRGLPNAEIAEALFMSVPTVKTHVGRIFDKLEVRNRVEVAICIHDAEIGQRPRQECG